MGVQAPMPQPIPVYMAQPQPIPGLVVRPPKVGAPMLLQLLLPPCLRNITRPGSLLVPCVLPACLLLAGAVHGPPLSCALCVQVQPQPGQVLLGYQVYKGEPGRSLG